MPLAICRLYSQPRFKMSPILSKSFLSKASFIRTACFFKCCIASIDLVLLEMTFFCCLSIMAAESLDVEV